MGQSLDLKYGPDPKQSLDARWPSGSGPFPTIFLVHGGYKGDEDRLAAIGQELADAGFCSVSVDFRGPDNGKLLTSIADANTAVAFALGATTIPTDSARAGILGSSLGGIVVGNMDLSGFGAVATLSGLVDVVTFPDPRVGQRLLGCSLAACRPKCEAVNAASKVTFSTPPWIVTNSTDEKNPLQQAEMMASALESEGIEHQLIVIPGVLHAQKTWPTVGDDVVTWFEAHL